MNSIQEYTEATKYLAPMLQEVLFNAQLITLKQFISESKTDYSPSSEERQLCKFLTKKVEFHYKSIIHKLSQELAIQFTSAIASRLYKKIPEAVEKLKSIAPSYLHSVIVRGQFPSEFEKLDFVVNQLKELDPQLLQELVEAIKSDDLEFFIAFHFEEMILDDLRAFVVKLPNEIYEPVINNLLVRVNLFLSNKQ